jgi:hypothetical protein
MVWGAVCKRVKVWGLVGKGNDDGPRGLNALVVHRDEIPQGFGCAVEFLTGTHRQGADLIALWKILYPPVPTNFALGLDTVDVQKMPHALGIITHETNRDLRRGAGPRE